MEIGEKSGKIFLFWYYHSSIQNGEQIITEHAGVLHQTAAGNFQNVQDWFF